MRFSPDERRLWGRYQVRWPVRVSAISPSGIRIEEEGRLDNISARGALARFAAPLPMEATVRLSVKLPSTRDVWIGIKGKVLRQESAAPGVTVAIEFFNSKPDFTP